MIRDLRQTLDMFLAFRTVGPTYNIQTYTAAATVHGACHTYTMPHPPTASRIAPLGLDNYSNKIWQMPLRLVHFRGM